MTTKERNEYIAHKWDFLLDKLDTHKSNQVSYAKMFEETAMNSSSNTLKLVLPMLQKILYLIPEVKHSTGTKGSVLLGSIAKELVIDGWTIMPDGAASFINMVAAKAVELYKSEGLTKINYIRLIEQPGVIQVHAFF